MAVALLGILSVLSIGLWMWSMLDMARRRFYEPSNRTLWLLVVLFLPLIGPVFYLKSRTALTTNHVRKFQPNFNRK